MPPANPVFALHPFSFLSRTRIFQTETISVCRMENIYDRLRDANLKLTPRRRAIIGLFTDGAGPLSPREVLSRLRGDFSRCGLPGVYRNLEALADCGVLYRVAGFGRERSYGFCGHDSGGHGHHHHHIVCVSCGRSAVIGECAYHEGMMIGGFRLVDHLVQLHGVCDTCREEDRRRP
jgi:Fur family transcriptional regulator, ferric uptake regulator